MSSSPGVSFHQSFNSCSATEVAEITGKFEGVSLNLKLNETAVNELDKFKDEKPVREGEREIEKEEEEEEEFSFVCMNPDGSPISADEIFQNGQIRPVFPLFNRDILFADGFTEAKNSSSPALRPPLRKLFVEKHDHAVSTSSSEADEPEGPFCVWEGKVVDASPSICKKSNSTGFSKLRRFRELVLRSNSDGKDAFVFLNHHNHNSTNNTSTITAASAKPTKAEKKEKAMEEKRQAAAKKGLSAHERFYVSNRAMKEEHKRRSYLPYRVGFFTNVSGLSRNVHPY